MNTRALAIANACVHPEKHARTHTQGGGGGSGQSSHSNEPPAFTTLRSDGVSVSAGEVLGAMLTSLTDLFAATANVSCLKNAFHVVLIDQDSNSNSNSDSNSKSACEHPAHANFHVQVPSLPWTALELNEAVLNTMRCDAMRSDTQVGLLQLTPIHLPTQS